MEKSESNLFELSDQYEPDLGLQKFINLFNHLANRHGRDRILSYLNETADVAPVVVEKWLNNNPPSQAIQNIITRALNNLPENYPPVNDKAPSVAPMPTSELPTKKSHLHTPTNKELLERAKAKNDRLGEIMANMAIRRKHLKDVLPGDTDTKAKS